MGKASDPGKGMTVKSKNKTAWFVRLRWAAQTIFMLLFLWLFFQTAFHAGSTAGRGVDLFFDLDPLALLSVWVGGHAAAAAMLFSLITLAVTFIFGRWFCGWFCPFGALHNLVSSWRSGTASAKVKTGGFSHWQHSKYFVLLAVLVAALVGANLVGLLDPFSFLFRSLTLAVFPAFDAGLEHFFAFLYRHDFGIGGLHIAAVSEPIYRWLHYYLLTVGQPRYFWSILFGVLFGLAAILNLFRARFWCKYICPLGALLGVAGRNPLLRLEVDPALCEDCGICVTECQGGANPSKQAEDWKPSECMYCLNCQSGCPENAIRLRFTIPGRPAPVPAQKPTEGE